MKNLIIVVLALLSVFLGYKAYFSPHADAKTGEAEEVSETYAMLMEQGVFDVQSIDPEYGIDVNVMIKHFHKFTLPRLRNPGPPNDENGTDGAVTSTIEFSKETLKKIMENDDEPVVRFYLAAFENESAKKYAKVHGLKLGQVVQKPVVVAKSKGKTVSAPISAIGKICPPPKSCP
jgi:hypothetical protein